jgi:hypothetical protein
MYCASVAVVTVFALLPGLSTNVFAADKKKNPKDNPDAIGSEIALGKQRLRFSPNRGWSLHAE